MYVFLAKTCEARLAAVRRILYMEGSCCLLAGTLEEQERSIALYGNARMPSLSVQTSIVILSARSLLQVGYAPFN
jgi:hypothetical protein